MSINNVLAKNVHLRLVSNLEEEGMVLSSKEINSNLSETYIETLNQLSFYKLRQIITCGKFEVSKDESYLTATIKNNKGVQLGIIDIRPPLPPGFNQYTLSPEQKSFIKENLLNIKNDLNCLTVDILDILESQLLKMSNSSEGLKISAQDILKSRGLIPKKKIHPNKNYRAGFNIEAKETIARQIELLSFIVTPSFKIKALEYENKKKKYKDKEVGSSEPFIKVKTIDKFNGWHI